MLCSRQWLCRGPKEETYHELFLAAQEILVVSLWVGDESLLPLFLSTG